MNYLAHYYFDQQSTDPYYILGIALPDLVKNHNRRWNVHPFKHESAYSTDSRLQSIYKGWERHLAVDHYFHENNYFIENSRFISKRMRLIPFENNKVKPFMIGHVGLELILDTLLIKNNSIDANSFYKQLAACDPEIIIEFLKINEIEDAEAFTTFYERFCSIQYLLSYKSNESIVYALNRIQYRLTQQFFTENDTRLMHHHIADLMDIVEHNYLTIFEEIALHLAHEKNNIT